MLQLVSTHIEPLERWKSNDTVWNGGEEVHGQIQVLQLLQVPELQRTKQILGQLDQNLSGAGVNLSLKQVYVSAGSLEAGSDFDSYLVWQVVHVPVHGKFQFLQIFTAAQLFGNKLNSVVAQQQLSKPDQLS